MWYLVGLEQYGRWVSDMTCASYPCNSQEKTIHMQNELTASTRREDLFSAYRGDVWWCYAEILTVTLEGLRR